MQIRGTRASVESTIQAKVNRVSAVFNRGCNAQAISRRGKQLECAPLASRGTVCRIAASTSRHRIDRSRHHMNGQVVECRTTKNARQPPILLSLPQSGNKEVCYGALGPTSAGVRGRAIDDAFEIE
jgi:hypothetical protein